MMNLVTASTITKTRKLITAGTGTAARRCAPASVMWRLLFREIAKGEYEPQLLKKNQTSISQDIEEKILSMYAKGMTTGDIESHIQ